MRAHLNILHWLFGVKFHDYFSNTLGATSQQTRSCIVQCENLCCFVVPLQVNNFSSLCCILSSKTYIFLTKVSSSRKHLGVKYLGIALNIYRGVLNIVSYLQL